MVAGPEGIAAAMEPGTVLVDTTTGDPATSRRLAEAVAAGGGHYADVPILGATRGRPALDAARGRPSERSSQGVRPVLERFAGGSST